MPISRPAVSQHLKVLREAGIVRNEPHGRQRVYSLDAARLGGYRRQLDQFWSDALGNLTAKVTNRRGESGDGAVKDRSTRGGGRYRAG